MKSNMESNMESNSLNLIDKTMECLWHELRVHVDEDEELIDLLLVLLLDETSCGPAHFSSESVMELCSLLSRTWMKQLQAVQKASSSSTAPSFITHLLKCRSVRLLRALRALMRDKVSLVMRVVPPDFVDMLILALQLLDEVRLNADEVSCLEPSLSSIESIGRFLHRVRVETRRRSQHLDRCSSSESSYDDQDVRPKALRLAVNPLDFEYFEKAMHSCDEAKFVIEWRRSRHETRHQSLSEGLEPLRSKYREQMELGTSLSVSEGSFYIEVTQLLFQVATFYVEQSLEGQLSKVSLRCKHLLSFTTHQLSKSLVPSQVFSLSQVAFMCLVALESSKEASAQVLTTELNVLGQKSLQLANKALLITQSQQAQCVAYQVATLILTATSRALEASQKSGSTRLGGLACCFRDHNGFELLELLIKTTADITMDSQQEEVLLSITLFNSALCSFLRLLGRQEGNELLSKGVKCIFSMLQSLVSLVTRLENRSRDKDEGEGDVLTLFANILHQLKASIAVYISRRHISVDSVWESWLKVASVCSSRVDMVKLVFTAIEHTLEQSNDPEASASLDLPSELFTVAKVDNVEVELEESKEVNSSSSGGRSRRRQRKKESSRDKGELNTYSDLIVVSDSDSAFGASDVSLTTPHVLIKKESKSSKVTTKRAPSMTSRSFLRVYVDLLNARPELELGVRDVVLSHLWKLFEICSEPSFTSHLMVSVTLPLLEDNVPKLMEKDREAVVHRSHEECLLAHCLRVLTTCLLCPKSASTLLPILRNCGLMSLLTTVLKSSSLLTEAAFSLIKVYLRAEMAAVLDDSSSSTLPCLLDTKEESSDELERHLTDEQIFQPTLMKALSLTTLMKSFNQLLVATTAKVLDLPSHSEMESSLRQLHWAWNTEARLVVQFDEFLDYGHTKGLSRMMESLLDHLLTLPQHSAASWRSVLPIVSDLLVILVQQVKLESRLSEELVADHNQILVHSLNKLSSVTMENVRDVESLRAVLSAMLNAAIRGEDEELRMHRPRRPLQPQGKARDGYEADVSEDNDDEDYKACEDSQPELASVQLALFSLNFSLDLLRPSSPIDELVASEVCELCLFRLRRSCERSETVLTTLATETNLAEIILGDFDLLVSQEQSFVINELLALLSLLFEHHLSRSNFRRMVGLLKKSESRRWAKHLLKVVLSVAKMDKNDEVVPKLCYDFPVQADVVVALDDEFIEDNDNVYAAVFNVSDHLSLSENFLLALWLSNQSRDVIRANGNSHLHLLSLSLSQRGQSVQLWTSVNNELIVHLCDDHQDGNVHDDDGHHDDRHGAKGKEWKRTSTKRLVASTRFSLPSSKTPWHHVSMRLSSVSNGITVILFVDGSRVGQQQLMRPQGESNLNKISTSSKDEKVCVGHTWSNLLNNSRFTLQLASWVVFDEHNVDKDSDDEDLALFLFLLGPDFDLTTLSTILMELSCNEESNDVLKQPLFLTRHVLRQWPKLSSKVARVTDLAHIIQRRLQCTLRASMQASRPTKLMIYRAASGSSGATSSATTCLEPMSGLGNLVCSVSRRSKFHSLISDEGGLSALILLVARMVELRVDDETLALSLQLLFSTMRSSSELMVEFESNVEVLARVLSDAMSNLGMCSTTVLINAMLTHPIIIREDSKYNNRNNNNSYCRFTFNQDSESRKSKKADSEKTPLFIHTPSLLTLLLLLWKKLDAPIEPRHRQTLNCHTSLEVFLSSLCRLVEGDMSVTKCNVDILNRLQMARKVVYKMIEDASFHPQGEEVTCEEVSCDKSRMEFLVGCSVALFEALLGSPVNMELVNQAMGLVMLAHGVHRNNVATGRPLVHLGEEDEEGEDEVVEQEDDQVVEDEVLDDDASRPCLLEHPWPWGERPIEKKLRSEESELLTLTPSDRLLAKLTSSLLHLLTNALRTMSDCSVSEALSKIFLPEHLIVLCNHPWSRIRAQSVSLLAVYVYRSRFQEPMGLRMSELQAYHLIINQLERHPVTEKIVNACLNLLHCSNVNHFTMTSITHETLSLLNVSVLRHTRIEALVPLMGLMPSLILLRRLRMTHHVLIHVHDICAKSTHVLLHHRQLGLFEVLAAIIRALCRVEGSSSTSTNVVGALNVIHADIFDLLRLLALRFVCLQGMDNLRQIDELLHLLLALSQQTSSPNERRAFREATCVVLEEALGDIESRLNHIERAKGRNKRSFVPYSTLVQEEKRERIFSKDMDTLDDDQNSLPTSFIDHDNEFSGDLFNLHHEQGLRMAGKSELKKRLDFLADFAVDFLIHNTDTKMFSSEKKATLTVERGNERRLFDSIFTMLIGQFGQRGQGRASNNGSVMSSASSMSSLTSLPMSSVVLLPSSSEGKCARHLLALINFGLNPRHDLETRLSFVHVLLMEHVGLLERLFTRKNAAPMQRHTFTLLLTDLLHSKSTEAQVTSELHLLRQLALTSGTASVRDEQHKEMKMSALRHEMDELNFAHHKASTAFKEACLLRAKKELRSRNEVAHRTATSSSSSSLSINQSSRVSLRRQEMELRDFMSGVRSALMSVVRTLQQCSVMIEHHTHEASLWRFEDKLPRSWALSETEGTQRTRILLQRRRIHIHPRHLLNPPQSHDAQTSEDVDEIAGKPFGFLLRGPLGVSSALIEQLSSREHIKFMERVTFVLADQEVEGELLVGAVALYFVEGDHVEQELRSSNTNNDGVSVGRPWSMSWPLSSLRELHSRWYALHDCAVELFFSNSTTRFFVFASRGKRQSFMHRLIECQPRLSLLPEPEQLMRSWQEGGISNFDYLMQLNKLAGRTFNDLMQYPVFPFVLADYTSPKLDLFDEKSFRNLRKPISVQKEANEQRYRDNYQVLADELDNCAVNNEKVRPNALGVGPFHYGSHYSSSGIVLHFLVRLPPFTSMFLRYQDGNFDLPDRSFHSLASTWRLASSESSSDVKELIPDLFTLPELLLNTENFDMGVRQNGDRVHHVQLPPWAKNDARLFIKIHRQALESDLVRETLNYWIDLVFGYKQQGKEAVNAINVFHPATYYGFDLDSIEDPVLREARATMIRTYGQTPKQLFRVPHPMITKKWRQSRRRREQTASFASNLTGDADKPLFIPSVMDSVVGLRWGNYVGSPSQPEPSVVLRRHESNHVAKLLALPNNEVYGLPPTSCLAAHMSVSSDALTAAALVTCSAWTDGHVRVHMRRHVSPSLLHHVSDTDKVLCVDLDSTGSEERFFMGMRSGKIVVISFLFKTRDLTMRRGNGDTIKLYGHTRGVRQLTVLPAFNILVSGSDDQSVMIWDLSSLVLIRRVPLTSKVVLMSASRTSGDVAIVTSDMSRDEKMEGHLDKEVESVSGDRLEVVTINGRSVASRRCEPRVCSLCYSCAPEGVSVNVIATGHEHGVIRLWSSWDLNVVRDLATNQSTPIVALTFSWDNQNLFVISQDDELMVYEKADIHGLSSRLPKFVNVSNVASIKMGRS